VATLRRKVSKADRAIRTSALTMIEDGRDIFRFDTFGDEEFWGDALRMSSSSRCDPRNAQPQGGAS
jgi:hypothetical protein